MKIGAISLGCDKNRVDTEKMLSRLVGGGHTLVGSEEEADVIIVNTCAFIDKAKEESIDEILNAIAAKTRLERQKGHRYGVPCAKICRHSQRGISGSGRDFGHCRLRQNFEYHRGRRRG